ncbi:hypothetical protein FHG87_018995 [Trinorchestia longiramus]|nr:hypothetical protein FHG87_018995 [Trinorchestia longiramus]
MGWTYLSHNSVQTLATTAPPTLETLNIAGHRHNQVRDEEVRALCNTTPCLRELDLSDCTELSGLALQCIAAKLKHLTTLALSRCYGLRSDDYAVLSGLPQLQHLSLFGANDECLKVVMKSRTQEVMVNRHPFSTVARPTVGLRRTSIWTARVRDT